MAPKPKTVTCQHCKTTFKTSTWMDVARCPNCGKGVRVPK